MVLIKNNITFLLTIYRNYLKKNFPCLLTHTIHGELFLIVPTSKLTNLIYFLNKHSHSQYKILADICAIDYPWEKNRFKLYYNILSITFNSRLTIISALTEYSVLNSITFIYSAANWFEREIWDMFGIYFFNHFDLRRILTDYGFKGHPLRKDFPLSGYTEIRHSLNKNRILVEKLNLCQDYKNFYFFNTWTKNFY